MIIFLWKIRKCTIFGGPSRAPAPTIVLLKQLAKLKFEF